MCYPQKIKDDDEDEQNILKTNAHLEYAGTVLEGVNRKFCAQKELNYSSNGSSLAFLILRTKFLIAPEE